MTDTATTNGDGKTPVVAEDNITFEVAERMAEVLNKAASAMPLRNWRYSLAEDAKEWARAASDFAASNGEGAIELVGSVLSGQQIDHGHSGWCTIVRHTATGLQIDDPADPRPVYRNFRSPASPVVVRR